MPHDTHYLRHILRAARLVVEFVDHVDQDAFEQDIQLQSSVNWQIAVIGEATKQVSKDFTQQHPDLPWSQMAAMRDRLIHGYDSINVERVWQTATVFVPELIVYLEPLIPPEEEGGSS